jgi:hypothetical protein
MCAASRCCASEWVPSTCFRKAKLVAGPEIVPKDWAHTEQTCIPLLDTKCGANFLDIVAATPSVGCAHELLSAIVYSSKRSFGQGAMRWVTFPGAASLADASLLHVSEMLDSKRAARLRETLDPTGALLYISGPCEMRWKMADKSDYSWLRFDCRSRHAIFAKYFVRVFNQH